MNHFSRMFVLLAVLLTSIQAGIWADEDSVIADRTALTFHDSGLYCNYNMVHGREPSEDGVTNLLDPVRAASPESPWAFFIMQYHAPEEARPDYVATNIREMARQGKKVILRAGIGAGVRGSSLDVDAAEQRLINLFQEVDPQWLYAVTLDEENIYWNGNAQALTELYYRVKARWPDLPVYQWWSPMIAPDVHATSGWVALPADGWVCDLYGLPSEVFEKKICMFLETGKPLVHIVWSSPTWMFHDRDGVTAEQWWPERGRDVFEQQVDVCRAYNVPVAHFCCQPGGTDLNGNSFPIRWGWHAVDPTTRQWFAELEALVSNFRYLPDETMGYRTLTPEILAWAHGGQELVSIAFTLDEQGGKRVSWRTTLADAAITPGDHALPTPYDNPYLSVNYTVDEELAAILNGSFGVAGREGYVTNANVVFRVCPQIPICSPRIAVELSTVRELGGSASLAWSADGENWSEPISIDPDKRNETLAIEPAWSDFSQQSFYVRVNLSASSGTVTNVCSSIRALIVEAIVEPPLETLVQSE